MIKDFLEALGFEKVRKNKFGTFNATYKNKRYMGIYRFTAGVGIKTVIKSTRIINLKNK